MYNDETVLFKGKKGGITIVIDDEGDFEDIKEIFRNKVIAAKKFFSDAKTVITFEGRMMSDEQEESLLKILMEESSLDITLTKENQKEAAKTTVSTDNSTKLESYKTTEQLGKEMSTYYYNGNLRSGQAIRYSGSVVIVGDVNPGSEVSAEGNIIILGSAKGKLHAGCFGDENCYVTALRLFPAQLRIADVITHIPKENQKEVKAVAKPLYAFLNEGKIYINEM
ncbi:MAG: septum site-determining protein MinC [Defluviitaleaceae bacterium]|nr:septum site-determining protein MinC [Defluviitaleaceae bacterium]